MSDNEAQKILQLIETVDPNDTEKLNEIDARVWCYLNGHKFAAAKYDRVFVLDEHQCEMEKLNGICTLKYTRSRDALKAIRPKGWEYACSYTAGKWADLWKRDNSWRCVAKDLPTEELAELHAVIQAIQRERENK